MVWRDTGHLADGEPVAFWEGKATYEQFETALLKALQEG